MWSLSQEQKEANKKRRKANRQAKMQMTEQVRTLIKSSPELDEQVLQIARLQLEKLQKENPHFDFERKKSVPVPEKLFCNTCEVEMNGLYGCEKGFHNNSQEVVEELTPCHSVVN